MAKCDGAMEVFSRCVGYFRPISTWNKGKQEEFGDRKTFKLGDPVSAIDLVQRKVKTEVAK